MHKAINHLAVFVVFVLWTSSALAQCTLGNITSITSKGGPLETSEIDANWIELQNTCSEVGGLSGATL